MKKRVIVCFIYALTALLLGNWAMDLETYSEASQRPISMSTYWVAFACLTFAAAAVTSLMSQRRGLLVGIVGCAIALPFCVLALMNGLWRFRLAEYEITVQGAVVMVILAIVVSLVLLRKQRSSDLHLSPG